jgi:hypothetical protein
MKCKWAEMSLNRSVSGEKILGRYVLVRNVIGPICLKNLGRSVHVFGPKRLGRNVELLGRSVFGPKRLTTDGLIEYLPSISFSGIKMHSGDQKEKNDQNEKRNMN